MLRGRLHELRHGDFRHYVTIQKENATQDAAGQPIPSWTAITAGTDIPCSKQMVSGGERFRGLQIEAGVTHLWTMHYRSDLLPQMRILAGSDAFNIVRADDPEGNRRFIYVQTNYVPAAVS